MASNKTVLVGGGVIITVGYANAVVTKGNPTRVIVGGMVFILLASLLELAGSKASALASGIVGVAVLTVILVEAPSIQQAYTNAQKNVGKSTDIGNPPPGGPPNTATNMNPFPAPGGRRYY